MRKNFVIAFVVVFLFLTGLLNTELVAKEEIKWGIDHYKYVYPTKEEYAIEFQLATEDTKKLQKALLRLPTGKTMVLKNKFNFNDFAINLKADGLSKEEFVRKYPEGKYQIILYPKQYGNLQVGVIHDFPPTPDITSPQDNDTDVSLTPEIKWSSLSGIDGLILYIKAEGLEEEKFELSTGDTSLDFLDSPLQSGTEYELRLETKDTDGNGNDMITSRVIHFTTVSQ